MSVEWKQLATETDVSGKLTNNVSATDKVLGRVSAGAGVVEEIACTSAGRALLDDANAAAQIATLGLDADIATFSLPASTTITAAAATVLDDTTVAAMLTTLGAQANTQNLPGQNKLMKIPIINPNVLGITTNTVVPLMVTDAAITITKLECRTSSASYEVAGDLKWADARIGLANAAVIETFDTSSGVRTDSAIASGAVASGKLIYLQFDSAPNALMTDLFVQITFDYD